MYLKDAKFLDQLAPIQVMEILRMWSHHDHMFKMNSFMIKMPALAPHFTWFYYSAFSGAFNVS
jgi:hypothetical protein